MPLRLRLERYFEFQALGADWKTEVLAGFTTFMTMAYIVFVNPAILHETGMPLAAVTAATCLSAAVGSFLMGGLARYPIALAPGMGLNAYFTYAVVKGMGVPWQVALGAVFLSGVAFLLLTLLGVRQLILDGHPARTLRGGGRRGGPLHRVHRLPQFGHHRGQPRYHGHAGQPDREEHRARAFRTAADRRAARVAGARRHADRHPRHHASPALLTGVAKWTPQAYGLGDLAATAGRLDIAATLRLGFAEIVFVFLFIDLFDNIGTLVAVGKKANLFDKVGKIPRINRILFSDAIATIVGACSRALRRW